MQRRLALMLTIVLGLTALPMGTLAEEQTSGENAAQTSAVTGEATPAPETAATPEPSPTAVPPTAAPQTAAPQTTAPQGTTPAPAASATPAPTASATSTPGVATPTPTLAPNQTGAGAIRVTMGADLTSKQRAAIYADFGVAEGSVTELSVTNAEERAYLEGLVPSKRIGSVALSCIYIETKPAGTGLTVDLHNINYCTGDMYRNALTTAGISDARVIVSAPYPVSGTGALTGAYKAYEDITGKSLSQLAKSVGAEELVVTGELAEYIGSDDATAIINELKGMLDQTQGMSDDQVKQEIRKLADAYKVTVTDGQVEQVLSLVRKLEGLDTEQLQEKLVSLAKTAQSMGKASETVSKVYESVTGFLASVGNFFAKLFAKGA